MRHGSGACLCSGGSEMIYNVGICELHASHVRTIVWTEVRECPGVTTGDQRNNFYLSTIRSTYHQLSRNGGSDELDQN